MGAKALPYMMSGSDRRIKQNIKQIGVDSKTGLPLYEFEYKFLPGRVFIGVMADDVEKVRPEAVEENDMGIKMVNYGMLGMRMVEA